MHTQSSKIINDLTYIDHFCAHIGQHALVRKYLFLDIVRTDDGSDQRRDCHHLRAGHCILPTSSINTGRNLARRRERKAWRLAALLATCQGSSGTTQQLSAEIGENLLIFFVGGRNVRMRKELMSENVEITELPCFLTTPNDSFMLKSSAFYGNESEIK